MQPPGWCPPAPAPPLVQDRRQLIGDCIKGSIAHLGWRANMMTGFLRRKLIEKFANPDHIESPDLKDPTGQPAIWRPGNTTGILIESVFRFLPQLVEKRPAVLIKRNSLTNMRLFRSDYVGADTTMFENFTTLWVGSHTVFCIHGSGAATEDLAGEVQRELTQFGPAFVAKLALKRFQVTEVQPIGILEEASQNFVVPLIIAYAYDESWRLNVDDSLPLTEVEIRALIRGDNFE